MSYNGIGLKTAKGSATSGHVQASLVKTQRKPDTKPSSTPSKTSKVLKDSVHPSMAAHLNKRQIEVQVAELREELEDRKPALPNDAINSQCRELRRTLTKLQADTQRYATPYQPRKSRQTPSDHSQKDPARS